MTGLSLCFRMEDSVEAGETDWSKLLGSLEVARLELENIFASVALLEIATDRLDMDRFKQLTRRAERALLTRYDSKSIHQFITSDSVQASDSEDQVRSTDIVRGKEVVSAMIEVMQGYPGAIQGGVQTRRLRLV